MLFANFILEKKRSVIIMVKRNTGFRIQPTVILHDNHGSSKH